MSYISSYFYCFSSSVVTETTTISPPQLDSSPLFFLSSNYLSHCYQKKEAVFPVALKKWYIKKLLWIQIYALSQIASRACFPNTFAHLLDCTSFVEFTELGGIQVKTPYLSNHHISCTKPKCSKPFLHFWTWVKCHTMLHDLVSWVASEWLDNATWKYWVLAPHEVNLTNKWVKYINSLSLLPSPFCLQRTAPRSRFSFQAFRKVQQQWC